MVYVPELDSDTSYIPPDFWKDEIILDNSGKPCYSCGEPSEFYNLTVGRHECELHTKTDEEI